MNQLLIHQETIEEKLEIFKGAIEKASFDELAVVTNRELEEISERNPRLAKFLDAEVRDVSGVARRVQVGSTLTRMIDGDDLGTAMSKFRREVLLVHLCKESDDFALSYLDDMSGSCRRTFEAARSEWQLVGSPVKEAVSLLNASPEQYAKAMKTDAYYRSLENFNDLSVAKYTIEASRPGSVLKQP